jgi:hypothetical protein
MKRLLLVIVVVFFLTGCDEHLFDIDTHQMGGFGLNFRENAPNQGSLDSLARFQEGTPVAGPESGTEN